MAKRKFVNNSPYPDYVIERIARCLWPQIQEDLSTEEGRRELAEWKAEYDKRKKDEPHSNKNQ